MKEGLGGLNTSTEEQESPTLPFAHYHLARFEIAHHKRDLPLLIGSLKRVGPGSRNH